MVYEIADSIDEASSELNYLVKLLIAISGTASLLDYHISLKKGQMVRLLLSFRGKNAIVNSRRYKVEKTKNVFFLRVLTGCH